MPIGARKRMPDGGRVREAEGGQVRYRDEEEIDCCCAIPSICLNWGREPHSLRAYGGIKYNGDDPSEWIYWIDIPEGDRGDYAAWYNASTPRCLRLLVWRNRNVVSEVIAGAQAPDHVIVTGGGTTGGLPYETSPGSGIPLDFKPYWFSACHLSGYTTGTDVHNVTLAEMQARRDVLLPPVPDGRYDVLCVIRSQHAKTKLFHGGTDIIDEASGGCVIIGTIKLQYVGPIV